MSFPAHHSGPEPDPTVSVIMAVYNGARYVRGAIDSILAQTFTDFEFVIVDDGSSDRTPEILASYEDPRIKIVENTQNVGLTISLNRGIRASRGWLIARQDADDVSLPERLAQQVNYLAAHPAVGLVGSGSLWVDAQGEVIREWQPLSEPAKIHQTLLTSIPFLHGTFMFRRACLRDIGGAYDESMFVAQDCDLLLRISEPWDLANVPDILYVHRRHEDTVTAMHTEDQQNYLQLAQQAATQRRLAQGWGRLGLSRLRAPQWMKDAGRRRLAQRYTWWSAGARQIDRRLALKFLFIALLLDPTTPDAWSYVRSVLAHKAAGIHI
jgi:glycosyltransferase involved in cell wall biosynthesis